MIHLGRGKQILLLVAFLWAFLPMAARAADCIIIQGAMPSETERMIAALADPREERVGPWRFVSGDYQGVPVVVSVTCVGMGNAAAATALGIERFHPAAVINQGTSGGHDPALHTFDIVIGASSVDYSAWIGFREKHGADGRHVEFYAYDDEKGEIHHDIKLPADAGLLLAAMRQAKDYRKGKAVVGTISTANSWNRQRDRIRFLHEQYGSSCEEMETHMAAQVCRKYGIPFIGLRILSNAELHDEEFNSETGAVCQDFALAVAKTYYEDVRNTADKTR